MMVRMLAQLLVMLIACQPHFDPRDVCPVCGEMMLEVDCRLECGAYR